MSTATSRGAGLPSLSLSEIRELGIPIEAALILSLRPRPVQVWAIRRLAGFPAAPTPARGLTVRVDKQDNVLSVEPAR